MNDKVVSQPVAKLLREAGWMKEVELYWRWSGVKKEYCLTSFVGSIEDNEYYAPDLLDLTREIRDIYGRLAYHNAFPNFVNDINNILWVDNEADAAAQVWLQMKKEGL